MKLRSGGTSERSVALNSDNGEAILAAGASGGGCVLQGGLALLWLNFCVSFSLV
jgi:hypothetical protein